MRYPLVFSWLDDFSRMIGREEGNLWIPEGLFEEWRDILIQFLSIIRVHSVEVRGYMLALDVIGNLRMVDEHEVYLYNGTISESAIQEIMIISDCPIDSSFFMLAQSCPEIIVRTREIREEGKRRSIDLSESMEKPAEDSFMIVGDVHISVFVEEFFEEDSYELKIFEERKLTAVVDQKIKVEDDVRRKDCTTFFSTPLDPQAYNSGKKVKLKWRCRRQLSLIIKYRCMFVRRSSMIKETYGEYFERLKGERFFYFGESCNILSNLGLSEEMVKLKNGLYALRVVWKPYKESSREEIEELLKLAQAARECVEERLREIKE